MTREIWKDIEGYEGLYQVSNLGRVTRVTTNRILKSSKHVSGYLMVNLSKNSVTSHQRIHRLVAQAFIPNPENKPDINHVDEDKTNNNVNNLEWSTRKENCNHGTRNERISKINSIPIISTNLKTGESTEFYGINDCARQLELQASNITHVLNGRRKQVGGYIFEYAK